MFDRNLEERVERVVRDLLSGRRLRIGPRDAEEREAILAASRLAGLRDSYPRMSPAFRRKLQRQLQAAPSRLVSRRDALVAGFAAAAGIAGTAGAARVAGLIGAGHAAASARAPLTMWPSNEIDPQVGTWFDAGPLAALPEGQAVHFRAGAVPAVLFREGSKVRGLSAVCTHLPCDLAWNPSARTLDCPCHNQSFDVMGESVSYDYPLPPLPTVRVEVMEGRVRVLGA